MDTFLRFLEYGEPELLKMPTHFVPPPCTLDSSEISTNSNKECLLNLRFRNSSQNFRIRIPNITKVTLFAIEPRLYGVLSEIERYVVNNVEEFSIISNNFKKSPKEIFKKHHNRQTK